ncbi:helix-turn-helix domain-containing protein [Riemerella columbipharyngis]|uniref:DNA binding domain-containing protein, excisionase family n=1 Tax=Riemerella columbipharyngis TaxID=1071918 RepID=A0A1G7DA50_9FLAO|nr:helix-turn-helix domain-containing protein [Riemerella columbipharyngis]SDE48431.1 DNA binding domain-containing protein, excisionase family [Riemerella columbipharyngis]
MEAIQFIGTHPDALVQEIKEAIIPELEQRLSKQFQPKEPTQYLTRKEVCELLDINLSTLHRWMKKGKITAYGLGNRVYFKRKEIEDTINANRI